jgi:hypothetical protein
MDVLRAGWTSLPDLIERTGWKAATVRAAISVRARKLGLTVECKRSEGITSYRVVEQ